MTKKLTQDSKRNIFNGMVTPLIIGNALVPFTVLNTFIITKEPILRGLNIQFAVLMKKIASKQIGTSYLRSLQYNGRTMLDEKVSPFIIPSFMAAVDASVSGFSNLNSLRLFNQYHPQKKDDWMIKCRRLLSATRVMWSNQFIGGFFYASAFVGVKPTLEFVLNKNDFPGLPLFNSAFLASFLSSTLANIFACPILVSRIYAFKNHTITIDNSKFESTRPWWLLTKEIYRSQGIKGLYRGFFSLSIMGGIVFFLLDFMNYQSHVLFPNENQQQENSKNFSYLKGRIFQNFSEKNKFEETIRNHMEPWR